MDLGVVLKAMRGHKGCARIQLYGCDFLAQLALKPGNNLGIGKAGGETMYKILKGEKVTSPLLIPVFLIDKSNVDKYGVDGWQ